MLSRLVLGLWHKARLPADLLQNGCWCHAILQACVNDVIDKALELEVTGKATGPSNRVMVVAVAVSVSVVVLLLGVALLWWLRRRSRKHPRLKVLGSKTGSTACSSADPVLVKDG